MAFGAVSVTTSATRIVENNAKRSNLTISNASFVDVFIGPDNTVTTANGIPLHGAQTRDQDKIAEGWQGDVWGIVETGTADVRFWETESS